MLFLDKTSSICDCILYFLRAYGLYGHPYHFRRSGRHHLPQWSKLARPVDEVTQLEADAVAYRGQKEAEAKAAMAEVMTDDLIDYEYASRWDGVLPKYVGGDSTPIMDMRGSNLPLFLRRSLGGGHLMFPIDRLAAAVYTMGVKKKGRNYHDQT